VTATYEQQRLEREQRSQEREREYRERELRRVMAEPWFPIPRSHYAVPITDPDDLSAGSGWPVVVGHRLYERKEPKTYKNGKTVGRHAWRVGTIVPAAIVSQEQMRNIRDIEGSPYRTEAVEYVLENIDESRAKFGKLTGRCGCCGKTLVVAESKMRGIGPECIKYLRFSDE
jgi:hypothetical protein